MLKTDAQSDLEASVSLRGHHPLTGARETATRPLGVPQTAETREADAEAPDSVGFPRQY